MSSPFRSKNRIGGAALVATLLALVACRREARPLRDEPPERSLDVTARESPIEPGGSKLPDVSMKSPAEGNAASIAEGQRLFNWYNCSGCHSQGGGGMGPPLMDVPFTYGNEPANIYQTILEGRPNGMPSWGGRIPEYQVWELVAYVRSLSGNEPSAATPGRSDTLNKLTTVQLK